MSLIIIRWSFEQRNPEQPPPPPRQRAILHRREGYLIILVLLQTTNMASFYARQGLLFITAWHERAPSRYSNRLRVAVNNLGMFFPVF